MGSFEKYVERDNDKKLAVFYEEKEAKPLEASAKKTYDYASDEFEEKLETQRRYYFEDTTLTKKKVSCYKRIEQDEDGKVEEYAQQYKNHNARKRKKSAKKARKAYESALEDQETLRKKQKKTFAGGYFQAGIQDYGELPGSAY